MRETRPTHEILSQTEWDEIRQTLKLSPREIQITQLIFDGCKEQAIANQLGISPHTVHSYVHRMFGKLGMHDQKELILVVFATYLESHPKFRDQSS